MHYKIYATSLGILAKVYLLDTRHKMSASVRKHIMAFGNEIIGIENLANGLQLFSTPKFSHIPYLWTWRRTHTHTYTHACKPTVFGKTIAINQVRLVEEQCCCIEVNL